MKQLSKVQSLVFVIGALLMVVGAGTSLLEWGSSPYIYSIGAIAFVSMQLQQRYEGPNFVIRRLRRIMIMSDICFLLAAVLMFANMGNVFGLSQITYVEYVYNKWVIVLLVADCAFVLKCANFFLFFNISLYFCRTKLIIYE